MISAIEIGNNVAMLLIVMMFLLFCAGMAWMSER